MEPMPAAATTQDDGDRTRGPALVLLAAVAVSIVVPLLWTQAPQDDAYISYVYARNFARGEGLVFNAGEEPVEGYTNFLWTLLLGAAIRAGLDPEWLAPALGLVCTAALTLLTAALARRLGASPTFAALAALLFATRPALTVHAMGGLETTFFGLLLCAGLLLAIRERRPRDDLLAGLVLAAAALTRPEGILVYGLLEAFHALAALAARSPLRAFLGGALRRGVPFGALVGGHFLWRYATYGDWLPNTFYAKVEPGPRVWADGADYTLGAIGFFGPILFGLPYLMLAARRDRRARLACLMVSTVFTAYVAYVGGDYLPGFRYLVPVLPLWCALAAASLGILGESVRPRVGVPAAAALLVALAAFHTWREHRLAPSWPDQDRRHRHLVAAGRKLNEILPSDAWIAVTNAGRLPWFAERRTLDMMGLSDRHIARQPARRKRKSELAGHLKGDGKYVLDREPEVIVLLRLVVVEGSPLADNPRWRKLARRLAFAVSERELVRDPRFFREYRLYSVALPDVDAWLNVFARPSVFADSAPAGLRAADRP